MRVIKIAIKKAINNDNIFDNLENKLHEFNQNKDNALEDENIEFVFDKYYISN